MWWLDVIGLAVVVALWFVAPRWLTLTSGFYRWVGWEHFVANARMQTGRPSATARLSVRRCQARSVLDFTAVKASLMGLP
jgi:hypothetical protein